MKFEKISYDEYLKDFSDSTWNEIEIKNFYDNIKIPTRSTKNSAGYDFYWPYPDCTIPKDTWITIPTGIRWTGEDCTNKVLLLLPRSGQGFNFGLKLRNTIGVIDGDYQFAKNEGHIKVKFSVEKPCTIKEGQGFVQGIILPFYTIEEDNVTAERIGGFGSTDIK